MVMLSDINSIGISDFTAPSGPVANVTIAPHAPTGLRYTSGGTDPSAVNYQGGDVGLMDGSVAWRRAAIMRPHWTFWTVGPPATPTQGEYIGFW